MHKNRFKRGVLRLIIFKIEKESEKKWSMKQSQQLLIRMADTRLRHSLRAAAIHIQLAVSCKSRLAIFLRPP